MHALTWLMMSVDPELPSNGDYPFWVEHATCQAYILLALALLLVYDSSEPSCRTVITFSTANDPYKVCTLDKEVSRGVRPGIVSRH